MQTPIEEKQDKQRITPEKKGRTKSDWEKMKSSVHARRLRTAQTKTMQFLMKGVNKINRTRDGRKI